MIREKRKHLEQGVSHRSNVMTGQGAESSTSQDTFDEVMKRDAEFKLAESQQSLNPQSEALALAEMMQGQI